MKLCKTEIETRFLDINKNEVVKNFCHLVLLIRARKLDEIIFHAADGSWIGKRKFIRLRK